VLGQSNVFAFPNWIRDYDTYWKAQAATMTETGSDMDAARAAMHVENAAGFAEHIAGVLHGYHVSYIELGQDMAIDKVCDIFTQINSRGIRLDAFDLINALLKPKDIQLRKMWHDAAPKLAFVESRRMNVYVLQVMSILLQAYCSPKYLYYLLPGQEKKIRNPDGSFKKTVLVADAEQFKRRWRHAVDALVEAIKLLRDSQAFGVVSSRYLPYASILPAFAAALSRVKRLDPKLRMSAGRKIRLRTEISTWSAGAAMISIGISM